MTTADSLAKIATESAVRPHETGRHSIVAGSNRGPPRVHQVDCGRAHRPVEPLKFPVERPGPGRVIGRQRSPHIGILRQTDPGQAKLFQVAPESRSKQARAALRPRRLAPHRIALRERVGDDDNRSHSAEQNSRNDDRAGAPLDWFLQSTHLSVKFSTARQCNVRFFADRERRAENLAESFNSLINSTSVFVEPTLRR